MDKGSIHILIEKYFEGETSLKEERWLREHLPSLQGQSGEIDEALAVMGYAANPYDMREEKIPQRKSYRWIAAVAASFVLLLAAGGVYSYLTHHNEKSTFIAYSGGVKIDREEAIRLISAQMEEMSEASCDVEAEMTGNLADFQNLFN